MIDACGGVVVAGSDDRQIFIFESRPPEGIGILFEALLLLTCLEKEKTREEEVEIHFQEEENSEQIICDR